MAALAVLFGKFLGAALSECAPVLEGIIYRALAKMFQDSASVGQPVDAFERMRNKDGSASGWNKPRSTGDGKDQGS